MGRLGSPATISTLVILRFGATMELGRSERTTMRPLWSYGVDGADSPDRKPRTSMRDLKLPMLLRGAWSRRSSQ
jgi:hypothetical protein